MTSTGFVMLIVTIFPAVFMNAWFGYETGKILSSRPTNLYLRIPFEMIRWPLLLLVLVGWISLILFDPVQFLSKEFVDRISTIPFGIGGYLFLSSFIFSVFAAHLIAGMFGRSMSEGFVRGIDYPYLLLSAVSLIAKVSIAVDMQFDIASHDIKRVELYSSTVLGFAVAIRLTRTSIEVFKLNKQEGDLQAGN